jgi:hypothetical protein
MVRRVTANLPAALLDDATRITGTGITETLIEGLQMLKRRRAATKAAALRGSIQLDIDTDTLRERSPETRGRRDA